MMVCPYCCKEVVAVEGSKQFIHVDPYDYLVCWKIPTYAVAKLENTHESPK